ncbi:15246_t:CDS:2, partial [Gigaspora margarita]
MQRYIVASRINVAPGAGQVAGREEAFGLVISCFAGPALNWYNTCIKDKNWRCNNLSDNLGVATLTTVRAIGARNGGNQIGGLNTAGEFRNKAGAEIGRIGADVATGADIIPNGTWDEDWSIAGGEPTDNALVAPNASRGFPTVTIAPGIKLGQLLYLIRTAYTTVKHLKQMAVFGQLIQGDIGVEEFSTRIKKVGKLARMTPEQQREQFIHGLNSMNQYNIRMMAKFEDTQENITRALAEAEKFTLSQRNAPSSLPIFLAANPYIDTNKSGITKTEIVDLIKTTMASSESQTAQQNADLRSTIKSFQETMSRATKTLDNSKKSSKKRAEDIGINRFLSNLLRKNPGKHPADEYDHDSIEDISDSLAGLTLNILQSELKLIFPNHFPQDPIKANIPNQAPLIQEKIESQSNTSPITEELS